MRLTAPTIRIEQPYLTEAIEAIVHLSYLGLQLLCRYGGSQSSKRHHCNDLVPRLGSHTVA
jgi:hypothetical protein